MRVIFLSNTCQGGKINSGIRRKIKFLFTNRPPRKKNQLICCINTMHHIIFIMGVSGSGKTTTGKLLAERIHFPFFDADDYHSPANIEKMKAGSPLTDADRQNWLQTMNQLAIQQQTKKGAVIACSALKQSYRDGLQKNIVLSRWFFLEGSQELILERMQKRKGHFMPPALLQSQLDSLEPPASAITIPIDKDPSTIVSTILECIHTEWEKKE